MVSGLAHGLAGGAAGTTALDVASYLDMTIRGRPASEVPQKDVERLAARAHIDLGTGDAAQQRTSGAGALVGLLTGLGGGLAYVALEPVMRRLPRPLAAAALGLGVMALTDGASTALGTTDPRQWAPADWVADAIPHLAYGAATVATADALRR